MATQTLKSIAILALVFFAASSVRAAAPLDADLIIHNGRILTVDKDFSVAQAAAIRDGKFIAVGSNGTVFRHQGRNTRTIDLQGRMAIPGLIDAHAHMDREGLRYIYPSLAGARTKAQILAIISAEVAKAQPGEWVVTMPLGDPPFHFDARDILASTGLNRYDLDSVSPNNPVYIRSIWGFWDRTPLVAVANSRALQLAGINSGTVPPYPGIVIEKDSNGQPTGVFRELNNQPALEHSLFSVVPRFTHQHRVAGLRKAMEIYNSLGTTSVYEGHGVASEVVRAYKDLWTRGEMTVRSALVISPTSGWYATSSRPELELMFRDWSEYASDQGFGDGFLRTTGVFIQGSGDPLLAAILDREAPYTAWASYNYDALAPEEFREVAMLAAKYNLRGHTTGVGTALDAFEQVNQTYPIASKRWVIEHIGTVTASERARMKALGIVPTAIPPSTVWKATPPATVPSNFAAYKSVLEDGLPLALATDNVPANPFFTLWTTIARTNRFTGAALNPSEKLTREQALRAMTVNGAILSFEEQVKGSIEVGKYADLVVIDRDYLAVSEDQIKDIQVEFTMVGGKVVYARP